MLHNVNFHSWNLFLSFSDFEIMDYSYSSSSSSALSGKSRALARRARIYAERGRKVLMVQSSKRLIGTTVIDELRTLRPAFALQVIHGDCDLGGTTVVGRIKHHLQNTARDQGEILLITHTAFLELDPSLYSEWVLIEDELPRWLQPHVSLGA